MNKNRLSILFVTLLISTLSMAQGKRVVFIGDSITDGAWGNGKVWNAPSQDRDQNDMNHIYGHSYMLMAASQIEATRPDQGWKFWNRGISGDKLTDLEKRWQKDLIDLKPDIVSILIGTNDVEMALNRGVEIDTKDWGNRFRSLLDEVLADNPESEFMLCTPFTAKSGKRGESDNYATREKMISVLSNEIRKICNDYHAKLVPFDTLVAETISSNPEVGITYWIWDGIHPTPAMHYKMAQMWLDVLNK